MDSITSQAEIAWRVAIKAGEALARQSHKVRGRRAVPVGASVERVGTYVRGEDAKSHKKSAREADSYRAARRNARRGEVWRGMHPTHRTVWPEFTDRERNYMAAGLNGPRAVARRSGETARAKWIAEAEQQIGVRS